MMVSDWPCWYEMCEELERAWHAKLTAWHLYQRAQEERTTTEAEALLPAAWATEEEYEALLRKCELAWSYSWYERQLAERGLSRHGMSVGPCW